MKIIDKWNEYVGPKDERIVAEENRVYKRACIAIAFGVIALAYYQTALDMAAMMGDLEPATTGITVGSLACLWVTIVFAVCCVDLARKGLVENNRFGNVDRYPLGYFSLCSGIGAGITAAAMFLISVIAQWQVLGADGIFWAGDAAGALVAGVVVFALCSIAFPIYFHSAKKNRDKDLEPED